MTFPTAFPPFPRTADDEELGTSSSASNSDVPGRNTAAPGRRGCVVGASEDFEEQDRQLAARYFVNAAADAALRMALGNLCKPAKCSACGITFLAMTERDALCHVCVGEARTA